LKTRVLSFALRAAGATGVAFQEFARWMSPWGWSRKDLSPVLRDLEEEGLTELTEDPEGEILALRLTQRGERELAGRAGR
jgi:DNA-binding PadR family transcriptional regulator